MTQALDRYDSKTLQAVSTVAEWKNHVVSFGLAPIATGWLTTILRLKQLPNGEYEWDGKLGLGRIGPASAVTRLYDFEGQVFPADEPR